MQKKLVKGNEAIVYGALSAGCEAFFGYPITPASEIAHLSAELFPQYGRVFLQAECEIGAANMLFGAASCGKRAMTASSGPGISLKQETVSFLAASEAPCLIVDIMRAGPGIGNIGPEQSDYFQIVKGGGHGCYKPIVLAPNSVSEMYDFAIEAFRLAELYRIPVYLLSDAMLGQMMEPIEFIQQNISRAEQKWSLGTTAASNDNLLTSIFLNFDEMEKRTRQMEQKLLKIEAAEANAEMYLTEDADVVLTGYGIVSRLLKGVVDKLRAQGQKIGLIRPKTLWPFPKTFYQRLPSSVNVLTVELSTGQFVEDVRLSLPNNSVTLFSRLGGNIPSESEIILNIPFKRTQ